MCDSRKVINLKKLYISIYQAIKCLYTRINERIFLILCLVFHFFPTVLSASFFLLSAQNTNTLGVIGVCQCVCNVLTAIPYDAIALELL